MVVKLESTSLILIEIACGFVAPLIDVPEHYEKFRPLKGDSSVTIGYGDSDIPPFEFSIPEGLELTYGFLKFNFFHFNKERKSGDYPYFDTLVIPVILRRARKQPS